MIFPLFNYIHCYGVCIATGALLGVNYLKWLIKKQYPILLSDDIAWNILILSCVSGFFGGKFLYLFMHEAFSWKDFLTFKGGFSLLGSVIAIFFTLLGYWHSKKLPRTLFVTSLPLAFLLVLFFGRIGCYFAGCCGGIILGINIPLQFISAFCYGVFFLIGHFLTLKKLKNNSIASFYGILIFCCALIMDRVLLDFFRNDRIVFYSSNNYISRYQIIAVLVVVTMIVVSIAISKKSSR